MAVIAIDLGGTKALGAVFDASGKMCARQVKLLDGAKGDAVGDIVLDLIKAFCGSCRGERVEAVGICVPGIVFSKQDVVWAPNIPGWERYPLKKRISGLVGPDVKVEIESDRTCYILGEVWKGAAKGCGNAIYIAVGTGIGVGILVDGRVLHGAEDIIGAAGWMALHYPYQQEYIPTGCFEYYASGNGIATQIHRALRCNRNYTGVLSGRPIDEITSHDVFDAYHKGDRLAAKVLDKAVEMWGMAAANLVSILNPEKVIFGGGVFGPAEEFIGRIYDEACKWGQPIAMDHVEFRVSEVQGEAALYGSAYLAFKTIGQQEK